MSQIRQLVDHIDPVRGFIDGAVRIAFVSYDDRVLPGLDKAAVLRQQLLGAPSLRVGVVPGDLQRL